MVVLFHFIALVALPIAVGYACRSAWQRPPVSRMIAATAVGGAAAVVGSMQLHMCAEGVPLAQWMIPGASGTAAMLFVGHRPLRRGLALASVMLAVALSFSFTEVVHGGGPYTGNPAPTAERPAARSEWHSFLTGLYRK